MQKIFYRWIRKAYHKQGTSDVPTLIKKQGTAEFGTAVAKVKKAYSALTYEGFNPRPARIAGKHTLSALSEHATGKALDITPQSANPQLTNSQWQFILKKAGKTVDRDKLKTTWGGDKDKAQEVWKTFKDVNDAFVKAVKDEADKITKEREAKAAAKAAPDPKAAESKPAESKPAEAKPAETLPDPLDEIFKEQPGLKAYKDGFFTLDWTLVEALHANGFNWGALFGSNVDLHHFELK